MRSGEQILIPTARCCLSRLSAAEAPTEWMTGAAGPNMSPRLLYHPDRMISHIACQSLEPDVTGGEYLSAREKVARYLGQEHVIPQSRTLAEISTPCNQLPVEP